ALAEQAASNIIRRRQELEAFEKQRLEFMGQDAIFSTEVEQTLTSGRYIAESEIHAAVHPFIGARFSRTELKPNSAERLIYTLEARSDFIEYIDAFIGYAATASDKDFVRRLRDRRTIPVTFSS